MSYGIAEFNETVLDALGIEVPEQCYDDYGPQADAALAEIARFQRIEAALREASQIPMPETIGYSPEREAAWRAGWNAALSRVYDLAQAPLAPSAHEWPDPAEEDE